MTDIKEAMDRLISQDADLIDVPTQTDAEKATCYIEQALIGFLNDPADSDFQRGYLAALLTIYEEGLGKGTGDDRLPLLLEMTRGHGGGGA